VASEHLSLHQQLPCSSHAWNRSFVTALLRRFPRAGARLWAGELPSLSPQGHLLSQGKQSVAGAASLTFWNVTGRWVPLKHVEFRSSL
jgi:hypothetical protein